MATLNVKGGTSGVGAEKGQQGEVSAVGGQKQELKEVTEVHVTEDEVTALMADRRYRNAGISRILARQLVGEEKKNKEAAVIRRAEEAQYDEAVKRKGKPEMEGWGRRTAEEEAPKLAEKVTKLAYTIITHQNKVQYYHLHFTILILISL